jgi:DNA-binding transcriptional ArsR family regulator
MSNAFDDRSCGLVADFFTILANPTRMRIFCALQRGPMTVTEIAAHAGASLPNISQHLRLMRDKGAVVAQKRGQFVYYAVADPRFLEAARLTRDALIQNLRRKTESVRPVRARRSG